MTKLATYVEMPTPRRATEDVTDDFLPADLTVAFGTAEAPVANSVPLHDFLKTAGTLTHAERLRHRRAGAAACWRATTSTCR